MLFFHAVFNRFEVTCVGAALMICLVLSPEEKAYVEQARRTRPRIAARCHDVFLHAAGWSVQGKRIWKLRGFSVTVAASCTARSLLHYWRTLYGYACACLISGAFCHVD